LALDQRLALKRNIRNRRNTINQKRGHSCIWRFVAGRTAQSDAISKDLVRQARRTSRGFKFAGTTICYAFMQATGLVNDLATDCFRYSELR
jgi:3-methyladenine DNA glycosylase Tag